MNTTFFTTPLDAGLADGEILPAGTGGIKPPRDIRPYEPAGTVTAVAPTPVPVSAMPGGQITHGVPPTASEPAGPFAVLMGADGTTIFGLKPIVAVGLAAAAWYFLKDG